MRRVTNKVRKVKSKRQLEHYVFGSGVHSKDKEVASRLRSLDYVAVAGRPELRPAFPRAAELAENLVRRQDGRWMQVKPEVYVKTLHPYTRKEAGVYFSPRRRKGGEVVLSKKTGQPSLQLNRTQAMRDVYLSLPPWISEVLADATQLEGGMATVRRVAEQAALEAAEVLEKRTGYKPVGIALHPDSRNAFGIHIQYLTIENGQKLGRSQGDQKGRRGIRVAGDVNCALYRFSKVRDIPGNWIKSVSTRDYDDIAMIDAMDKLIDELLPRAGYLKESYVDEWLERRRKGKVELVEANQILRQEKLDLEEKNKRLNKRINKLQHLLSLAAMDTRQDRDVRDRIIQGMDEDEIDKGPEDPAN